MVDVDNPYRGLAQDIDTVVTTIVPEVVEPIMVSANSQGVYLDSLAMDIANMTLSFHVTIDSEPYQYTDAYRGDWDRDAFIDLVRRKIQEIQKHHAQLDAQRVNIARFTRDLYHTNFI